MKSTLCIRFKNRTAFTLFVLLSIYNITYGQIWTEQQWYDYFKHKKNIEGATWGLKPNEGIWEMKRVIKVYGGGGVAVYSEVQENAGRFAIDGTVLHSLSEKISPYFTQSMRTIDNVDGKGNYQYVESILFGPADKPAYQKPITLKSNVFSAKASNFLEFSYEVPDQLIKEHFKSTNANDYRMVITCQLHKIYPSIITGTGFAIHRSGIIITCYHVVESTINDYGGKIYVRGIGGDFDTKYKAHIIGTDIENDLALLYIDNPKDYPLNAIPYSLSYNNGIVGQEAYCLGYPLMSTMGEELKLTSGIISSLSGFKGNTNIYQTTLPIQPGNSGGPLFDGNGYVIGVMSAKHTSAENASYAVKAKHLKPLLAEYGIEANQTTNMRNKPLPEQVKLVRNFVYILEIE